MKNILFLRNLYLLLFLFYFGCSENNGVLNSKPEIPSRNHDLSYTPYDAKLDNPDFIVCDSTNIGSGRNRLQYPGGKNKLRKDLTAKYLYKKEYAKFSGYVVIRFLVNCEGKSGRYRSESLNLDFSPASAPPGLLTYAIGLVKSIDHWTKSAAQGNEKEYSKYINLKIKNGKIEYVLF